MAAPAKRSVGKLVQWGRENGPFLGLILVVVGGTVATTRKVVMTTRTLHHEQDVLRESIRQKRELLDQEHEMREKVVEQAVLGSHMDLANRLQDVTFSEECQLWRDELLTKAGKK